ncbi:hypothetical protein DPSP01_009909 [Paraphaeosphaeria sporulosa]|uniref:Uncharacterized protein n=1 Tax=Paraphaeosphaeria sporulosa TaxID=1460663 RepID=A0A177BZZ9_9PLEO|nr:uncharacterized protein CC84DRAFT_1180853 [Paraphaeosphaeria sporulosa]OAG00027.1 hypothetical protein CC84DRAFT_1180853 [Paraphaeosphaeria sporulosa]
MHISIFFAGFLSLVLPALSAAIADPQQPPFPVDVHTRQQAPTTGDQHPLCGAFAWWNNGHWQEEQLWEIRDCTKFYVNVGRVNMEEWGKCLICFFFPSNDCSGHNTLTMTPNHGWVDTKGDVWSYKCSLKE